MGLGVAWLFRGDQAAAVGQPAPDFTVEIIEGGDFTLSEALGRPVVLNFWASWCLPCRTEIPDISAFAAAHPDVQVIGVAVDDAEDASRMFADEVGASYPLALGTSEVEAAYPRFGMPVTYIIDEDGKITDVVNGLVDEELLEDLVG